MNVFFKETLCSFGKSLLVLSFLAFYAYAASVTTSSLLDARCSNDNTGILELVDNFDGTYYNKGAKISFSVEEKDCPRKWEWGGANKDRLYSYKKTVPKASFSCVVSSMYGNKVFVRECEHSIKGEYNLYKRISPRINDYEYGIEVTDPSKFENGGSYFVKGTFYSNGEQMLVGGGISWTDRTKTGKSTIVVKQGVRLEKKSIPTVSCTIENVHQQEGYVEVSNCNWSYNYDEFYLKDPNIQDSYPGYRLYRSNGTLKYQGSIDVDKKNGNIVADGYCYSSDGMKATKRVNRLDSCK